MDAAQQAEDHFRKVGLPELVLFDGRRPVRWRFLAVLFALTAGLVWADVVLSSHRGWLFSLVEFVGASLYILFLVVVLDECARHKPRAIWRRVILWLGEGFIGLLLVNQLLGAASGEVPGAVVPAPTGAYAVAWATVIGTFSVVGAIGGVSLVRRVGMRALLSLPRSLPVLAGAVPVMLGFAAALVLVPDVWRLLAPMAGWRTEVVIIASVALMFASIHVKLRGELKTLDSSATGEGEARANNEIQPLIQALEAAAAPAPHAPVLPWRARLNITLSVVLPLLVRFLVAALLLAAVLLGLGLILFDPHTIAELAPRAFFAVAAAKVACTLSVLAAVLVTLAFPRETMLKLAESELMAARRALRVWSVYRRAVAGRLARRVARPRGAEAGARSELSL